MEACMTGPFQLNANRLSDRIEMKPAAHGRAARMALSAAVASAITSAALAQPLLTQLTGTATPTGLSNPQGGIYFIGAANGRWNLNHGVVTFAGVASSGGGRISADGAYQTCMIANNGAISGNTAGVLPAFSIPGSFAPFTFTPASDLIAARYTAASSSIAGLPGFLNNAYSQSYQVFGSGDSGNVHAPMGISQNGRFIVVQGYVSTYNSSAQSVTITGITPSGGVATVTTTSAHLLANGNQVTITGSDVPAYNAAVTVTGVPTPTTLTFLTSSADTGTGGSLSFPPGTRVTVSNTLKFRGGIWDANTNTMRLLPTPFRTTTQTTRRRDGTAFGVSDDGLVVVGAQEPNLGTTPTSNDPDGGRLVLWRWNGSDYVMSYLPNGVNASGFPITFSISAGQVWMNAAGTTIVGPAFSDGGAAFIAKWVWNAGTSSWNAPINLGSNINPTLTITTIEGSAAVTVSTATPHNLAVSDMVYIAGDSVAAYNGMWEVMGSEDPTSFTISAAPSGTGTGGTVNKEASWLPSYVRNCPGTTVSMRITGMSGDGNTVVGSMSYNAGACDSTHNPAPAGWIWTAATGYMEDWYDHLSGMGVAGLGIGEPFGPPSGDSPPLLGGPTAIAPDASAFVGGLTLVVGAHPWVLAPRGCGTADFNCDGDTGTDSDIESFFACLAGTCPAAPCNSSADLNGDGDVGTDADIESFFRVLGGGPC
jgi:hypothetical protein